MTDSVSPGYASRGFFGKLCTSTARIALAIFGRRHADMPDECATQRVGIGKAAVSSVAEKSAPGHRSSKAQPDQYVFRFAREKRTSARY
jgi:hypothetical protein